MGRFFAQTVASADADEAIVPGELCLARSLLSSSPLIGVRFVSLGLTGPRQPERMLRRSRNGQAKQILDQSSKSASFCPALLSPVSQFLPVSAVARCPFSHKPPQDQQELVRLSCRLRSHAHRRPSPRASLAVMPGAKEALPRGIWNGIVVCR